MDVSEISNTQSTADKVLHPDGAIGHEDRVSVQALSEPRPVSEITAEIIQDMDRLCDWLHKVQKMHLEITRLRKQRMEAEIAARWAEMHERDELAIH